MTNDDSEQLRRYRETGCGEAFRLLVERHAGLVYGTALRKVNGDTHLAQDVTQLVFCELARKARSVAPNVVLAGWLHRCACLKAAQTIRTERRRYAREQMAIQMQDPAEREALWREMCPLLDEALDQLSDGERDAVLLRFFQSASLRDVGHALGVSEDGAQKRVSRALDHLRRYFKRQGISCTTGGLAAALAGEASSAALPPGLTAAVTASALAAGTVSAGTTVNLIEIMTMSKMKVTAVSALILAALSLPVWQQWQRGRLTQENEVLTKPSEAASRLADEQRVSFDGRRATAKPGRSTESGLESLRDPGAAGSGSAAEGWKAPVEMEPWRQVFEATYKLRDGEVVRHIPAPFIAEREEYYRREHPHQARLVTNAPDYFVFRQDERGLHNGGYGFVDKPDLQHALRYALGLSRYELAGAEELLALPITGDWVIREGASIESQLAALEPVLREATGRNIMFSRQTIEDDVVVVRGSYAFEQSQKVEVFAEEKNTGSGGGSGDFQTFLKQLGDRMNIAFANEAQVQNESRFSWYWHRDSAYSQAGERRSELGSKVLQNLSQQTGLRFELQRRPTRVWFVQETAP